jgi:hypothetical protein
LLTLGSTPVDEAELAICDCSRGLFGQNSTAIMVSAKRAENIQHLGIGKPKAQ